MTATMVSLGAASLLALLAAATLAAPCMAGDDPVVRTIWEREPEPTASMVFDVVVVTMLDVHGVTASPPPPRYDKPYANAEVVFDLPGVAGEPWGLTEPPARPGGRCVIHLAPLGSVLEYDGGVELLEPVGLPKLIQHEIGHCRGLVHPGDRLDEWAEIADADRGKIAAIARRQWLQIKGQRDVASAPARNATVERREPPKARREITRRFSGDGY
jgi:hypothetical protein